MGAPIAWVCLLGVFHWHDRGTARRFLPHRSEPGDPVCTDDPGVYRAARSMQPLRVARLSTSGYSDRRGATLGAVVYPYRSWCRVWGHVITERSTGRGSNMAKATQPRRRQQHPVRSCAWCAHPVHGDAVTVTFPDKAQATFHVACLD